MTTEQNTMFDRRADAALAATPEGVTDPQQLAVASEPEPLRDVLTIDQAQLMSDNYSSRPCCLTE